MSYRRAMVLTFGMGLVVLMEFVWVRDRHNAGQWPWYGWGLLGGLAVLGVVSILVGVFARKKTINTWADAMGTHEVFILIAILAAPVYWTVRAIDRILFKEQPPPQS